MKYRMLSTCVAIGLTAASVGGCSARAQEQATVAPVQVGQTYEMVLGSGAYHFKVLEVGKGGLIKVEQQSGETWWLNLHQVGLVEARQ